MRKNKEKRAEKERQWQEENDMPNATCSGIYIGTRYGHEDCQYKNNCDKYMNHQKACYNGEIYDLPIVRFYYVDSFRKCKFRKEKEE